MRAWELRGTGLDSLALAERRPGRVLAGQVRVRIRAASLNYRDLLIARGQYGRGAPKLPLIPLSDGAGEVLEIGPGVESVAVGDRVAGNFFQRWYDGDFGPTQAASALGGAIDGILAEEVVLEEAGTVRIPDDLSFEEAAALPCAAVTAWVGLMQHGDLRAGETVLAMGTGGVSIFALQLAKAAGAHVVLTSSSDDKLARGRALGADHTINYRTTPHWDVPAREVTGGRGVDHLLEVGGAGTLARSVAALRDGGHLSLVGLLTGAPADRTAAHDTAAARGIRVDSIYVGSSRHFRELLAFMTEHRLRPVLDRVFPFEDAPAAYRHLESGAHFGKVVVSV